MSNEYEGPDRRQSVDWNSVVSHMATTNTKLDGIHDAINEMSDKIKTQNGRIGKLENWKSYVFGIGGACGGILTLATVIITWVKK